MKQHTLELTENGSVALDSFLPPLFMSLHLHSWLEVPWILRITPFVAGRDAEMLCWLGQGRGQKGVFCPVTAPVTPYLASFVYRASHMGTLRGSDGSGSFWLQSQLSQLSEV